MSMLRHVLFLSAFKKALSFTCYGVSGIWPGQEAKNLGVALLRTRNEYLLLGVAILNAF